MEVQCDYCYVHAGIHLTCVGLNLRRRQLWMRPAETAEHAVSGKLLLWITTCHSRKRSRSIIEERGSAYRAKITFTFYLNWKR